MRRRFIGSVVAGLALVASTLLAGTASAQSQATWTVTPGGNFAGAAGTTILTLDNGIQLYCTSADATGSAKSGSGLTNPLATIGDTNFDNCTGPFNLKFEVEHVGVWDLNGATYSGGTTTGTITNIEANLVGPSCNATVAGYVDATYTNGTADLVVIPNFTLEITYVDPNNTCLGLIQQGQTASFDGTFDVTPGQTITSP